MADTLKYGWVRGGKEGREFKVSNSQYFNRLGGAFVAASGPAREVYECSNNGNSEWFK